VNPALRDLLQRQQRDGFPDLTGTEVGATIPVSERLINEVLSQMIPPGGRVREVRFTVAEGNQVTAEIRLSGPSFLPAIPLTFAIEDQPRLPERPTLGLRLQRSAGLVAMTASLLPGIADRLPAGITLDGDRLQIDLRRLLADRNAAGWLDYATDLRVNTRAGAVILDVRGRISPR
jgi:hypothetical protein